NIKRAVKKGTGELDEGDGRYEDATYEGYGPGGIAYFIEVTTNNYNRTVGEIRHIFSSKGGNLDTDGSMSYMIHNKGRIRVIKGDMDEEEFMLADIEAGAEDIEVEDAFFNVVTGREEMYDVRERLENNGYEIKNAELVRIPDTEVNTNASTAESNLKLMNAFDDNDDVSNIFTNMQMDEDTLAIAEELA